MSGLKTIFLTLALLLPAPLFALSPGHGANQGTNSVANSVAMGAPAVPTRPEELVPIFATCLGRYSAQMEDSWNGYQEGDPTAARRANFEGLLDAIRPASAITGREILRMRLEAKFAQARLLSIARFHTDPTQKRRARAQAAMALRPCEALIL